MATELTFAKTFLTLLDSKPSKISPDHIEDPRTYPGSSPYTLPRHPSCKPFSKPSSSTTTTTTDTSQTTPGGSTPSASKRNPGAERATKVVLRSPRNPPFDLTLPAVALSTSLAEIKERVADETGIGLEKIKLLHNKKPVGDSKVLKDLLPGGGGADAGVGEVELGVMVLGGGSVVLKKKEEENKEVSGGSEAAPSVAQGLSGSGVLQTEEFWGDLKGFLQQRVRDEGIAGEAAGVFRAAWEGRSS